MPTVIRVGEKRGAGFFVLVALASLVACWLVGWLAGWRLWHYIITRCLSLSPPRLSASSRSSITTYDASDYIGGGDTRHVWGNRRRLSDSSCSLRRVKRLGLRDAHSAKRELYRVWADGFGTSRVFPSRRVSCEWNSADTLSSYLAK